jgi:hypothetical protein
MLWTSIFLGMEMNLQLKSMVSRNNVVNYLCQLMDGSNYSENKYNNINSLDFMH